ncbi:hypothetical protein BVG79_p1000004 (plasmid) [Ketogulonicigenium robustum]|uniref:Uncharacterized protein n=1 Tax=Ketogulonicigenium robustum TaxID=92947 RepID=A0A1W6P2U5_9RHOB|nr:hypothetical protein [Ketogulonicigenium robustum]ARO15806.1 hypothetical protein BVG79_p1000004 [Ketogulonicigenium robustum]
MIDDPIRALHMNCTAANMSAAIINGPVVMVDRRQLPCVDAVSGLICADKGGVLGAWLNAARGLRALSCDIGGEITG